MYKVIALAILTSGLSFGDMLYNVVIDTSPLIGHSAGPFSLELQFNDGTGTGDANNSAFLSAFLFGTGGPSGTASIFGGVTGNMGSSVTMIDSSFFNQFIQGFNPGATLSLQLALTTNVDAGGTPDEFSLSIVDSSGFEIPTFGPANALLIIDIDSATPTVSTFSTDTSQSPNAGGPPINIGAPQIGPVVSSVPEPSSLSLLAIGLAAVVVAAGRGPAWKRRTN